MEPASRQELGCLAWLSDGAFAACAYHAPCPVACGLFEALDKRSQRDSDLAEHAALAIFVRMMTVEAGARRRHLQDVFRWCSGGMSCSVVYHKRRRQSGNAEGLY